MFILYVRLVFGTSLLYIQDYFVDYNGINPIRKASSLSKHVLCWYGFRCNSGWQCKYAHCVEELAYWKGR